METTLENWARDRIAGAGGFMLKLTSPGTRGIPDDIILWPRTVTHFAEFKDGDEGRLSIGQAFLHNRLLALGHDVHVFRTKNDVLNYIERYGCD